MRGLAGNYVYKNGELQFFNHPEGYVERENDGTYSFVYQYKDHLGNIRLSYSDRDKDGKVDVLRNTTDVDGDGDLAMEIKEVKDYYPFGLEQKRTNSLVVGREHKYQTYQGKEDEKELGKNTYAFGWRDYDPALGRFNKVDRFSEKYYAVTPYHFSANNPIFFKEINGDSIQGVSRKSARRTKRIIRKTFKKNKKLARLFKKKGKKFKGISQQDFDEATKNSDVYEKALAKGYFDAVNSGEIHTVEVVRRGEKLKSSLSTEFGEKTGKEVEKNIGSFNYKTSSNSTHSVIVFNPKRISTDVMDNSKGVFASNIISSAGEKLAHELVGHGLSTFNQNIGNQHVNAVQVSNLYKRVINGGSYRYYRNGTSHAAGDKIPGTIPFQVPSYLK